MRDPFQRAQEQWQSKKDQANVTMTPTLEGLSGQQPQEKPQGPSLDNLMENPQGPSDNGDPSLTNGYRSLDINPDNIPLNSMGRQILVNRLKNRWGDQWDQRADVKKLLSDFDAAVEKDGASPKHSIDSLISQGKRTLEALNG